MTPAEAEAENHRKYREVIEAKSAEQLAADLAATPHGVLGTTGGRSIPAETRPPLGPDVDVPTVQTADETSGSSPLSVRDHMARLTVVATKLDQEVAEAKTLSDKALDLWRAKRDEFEETTRILRAYERIRSPRRRKP